MSGTGITVQVSADADFLRESMVCMLVEFTEFMELTEEDLSNAELAVEFFAQREANKDG